MKIINILEGMGSLIKGDPLSPEQKERANICQTCPFKTFHSKLEVIDSDFETKQIKGYTCDKCSCYIPAKIRVNNEKCPLNKWNKIKK